MNIRINKLKEKEVINICNGKKLGYISDFEIDACSGKILKIIVPKSAKCLSFTASKNSILIPWSNIEKIGDDAVLVRLAEIAQL